MLENSFLPERNCSSTSCEYKCCIKLMQPKTLRKVCCILNTMKASIILPAYNEGENIGSVIRAIKKTGDHEIILVDDGSKDNTLEVARAHGCICVRLNKNR